MLERFYNTAERKGFFSPGRLLSGPDTRFDVPGLLGAGPVLAVVDGVFTDDALIKALDPADLVTVTGEPFEAEIREAAGRLGTRPRAILALGGGSTIDTAKALLALTAFGTLEIRDRPREGERPGFIAVPTLPAAGSETSRFALLCDRNGVKQSLRSWTLVPDLAVLDPVYPAQAPAARLALGAFDAFCHLWETFICRSEQSLFTDMLAREGVTHIAQALDALHRGAAPDPASLAGLQWAAAAGGMAISNVRTGMVHTLGESLAAQAALSHPETLWVFFEPVLASYRGAVAERIASLEAALRAAEAPITRFDGLIATWRDLFHRHGISERIARTLAETAIDFDLLRATIARDSVLAKENPIAVTGEEVATIAVGALAPYGRSAPAARTGTEG